MTVAKGQVIRIRAEGQWRHRPKMADYGPDGSTDGQGKLRGRIGQKIFSIGKSCTVTAEEDGVLHLGMNDSRFRDNKGTLTPPRRSARFSCGNPSAQEPQRNLVKSVLKGNGSVTDCREWTYAVAYTRE